MLKAIKDLKVVNNVADLPGLAIDGLKATTGSTNLQVTSEKKAGFDQVTVQLPADAKGRVEYTLEYTASASRNDFRFPVPVPTVPVAASVPSFFATVTLPPNTNFQGDEFPRLRGHGAAGRQHRAEDAGGQCPCFYRGHPSARAGRPSSARPT